MLADEKTVAYFNQAGAEYSTGRFEYAIKFINDRVTPETSLLDVGCGVGNILELFRNRTSVRHLAGIDAAPACVEKTKGRLDCEAYVASILDKAAIQKLNVSYDFVVIAAVLHHLVGPSRAECRANVITALENCLAMVRPGGHLIVSEPGIYPAWTASALYHTKRFVTRFTSGRVQIFDKWNNIGAPVISYFTDRELAKMIEAVDGFRIAGSYVEDIHVNLLWRLCGIRRRINTTIIAQRHP